VADAKRKTAHDFGKNILPAAVDRGMVLSCPLEVICPDEKAYWRDVGSIDSYFQANMDLLNSPPEFELADPRWARTSRFREWVPACYSTTARINGEIVSGRNLVSSGVNIDGSQVVKSVLSPRVRVGKGCELDECILFPDAEIGEGTKLRRVMSEGACACLRECGSAVDSGEFDIEGGVVVIEPTATTRTPPTTAAG
jgi:glucose-1-phosphate adenylyltransferase